MHQDAPAVGAALSMTWLPQPWLLFWKLPAWDPFRNDAEGMAMLRAAGVCST